MKDSIKVKSYKISVKNRTRFIKLDHVTPDNKTNMFTNQALERL